MMTKYILHRQTSSGLTFYKCDFVDRGHHRRQSTLESKAIRYDADEVLKEAADRDWMIASVNNDS